MKWKSSPYAISDIKEWRDTQKLEIRPDFQRKAVWSAIAQVMLIDSIIKDIPMPKIYLETKMVDDVKYRIVIDGQQRLTAIFDYIDGKFTMPDKYGEKWAGKTFEQLDITERNIILDYMIDTNSLTNPTQEEVNDLYSRVNKYTVQLNRQELRRADYPGDFIKLAEKLAALEFFADARMFTAAMTRRMLDIEYVEELLCIVIDGIQNKKETIDSFCEKYQVMPEKEVIEAQFMNIISDIITIFTEDELIIRKSRFKQRTDFYTMFSVIDECHKNGKTINTNRLESLRENLKYLNDNIGPHAEQHELSEYAIYCTSDANSITSRQWRKNFLQKFFDEVYE